MAWRIGDRVVRGELNNTSRNSVHGWLDFGGDWGIKLDLTGNFEGELAGMCLRFETARSSEPHDEASDDPLDPLESQQIGAVGSMVLRMVRVPLDSLEEFRRCCERGESPRVEEKPCLYLEWFSQNGRVVAEIIDSEMTWSTADGVSDPPSPEPLPDPQSADHGLGIVGYRIDEDGHVEELSSSDHDDSPEDRDPYHLFSPDLERQLTESLDGPESAPPIDREKPGPRSWDDVIPGIDEETKKLYEQWDEVVHGEKDEPLSTLFDPPLSLKQPDDIANEAEATASLMALLARLAMHGVALDMCKHYSALDAYRLLVEDILPEAQIHPQLRSTGFIQHYSTWEHCAACAAELDAE